MSNDISPSSENHGRSTDAAESARITSLMTTGLRTEEMNQRRSQLPALRQWAGEHNLSVAKVEQLVAMLPEYDVASTRNQDLHDLAELGVPPHLVPNVLEAFHGLRGNFLTNAPAPSPMREEARPSASVSPDSEIAGLSPEELELLGSLEDAAAHKATQAEKETFRETLTGRFEPNLAALLYKAFSDEFKKDDEVDSKSEEPEVSFDQNLNYALGEEASQYDYNRLTSALEGFLKTSARRSTDAFRRFVKSQEHLAASGEEASEEGLDAYSPPDDE